MRSLSVVLLSTYQAEHIRASSNALQPPKSEVRPECLSARDIPLIYRFILIKECLEILRTNGTPSLPEPAPVHVSVH